ncbi:MAG: HAD-IB family hydrolase [Acidimicrobiales bacterium]|nr:HAD-IB family hydrolase [Acidimicrobiales bacterium]
MEAAFFDLDKTVIARATLVAFSTPLRRKGMITRRLMARAVWAQIVATQRGVDEEKLREYREQALRVTKGWDRQKLVDLITESLDEVVEPIVYREALDLMDEHRAAGRRIYLVSASPEEIVTPLGRYLGVDATLATQPQVDAEGRYTGQVKVYNYGVHKVAAIEEEARTWSIDLDASYAYSDSITDLPMLEAVGHPVVVNPDKSLLKVAAERSWEIRVFEHPESLRGSLPRPTKRQALVGGGTAAAVAVAGTVWAAGRRLR